MADVAMPRLSDSMEEGTILKWLKSDGDDVKRGDELVEIETDKANMTYEADQAGVLKIVAQEGDTLPVGDTIAQIGDGSGSDAGAAAGGADQESQASGAGREPGRGAEDAAATAGDGAGEAGEGEPEQEPQPVATEREPEADEGGGNGRVKASPVARRMARELGVELARLEGSGPGGRIVKADVEAAAGDGAEPEPEPEPEPAAEPAAPAASADGASGKGDTTVEELSRLQKTIARRMAESKATAPEFVLTAEVDMQAAVEFRKQLKAAAGEDGTAPSFNDFVVKASALALREFPRANGAYRDGRFELYSRINVGIAVAGQDALIVPTIFDADRKSLGEIARDARALAGKVRDGSVSPPELSAGTFSVSNLGMFGIKRFTAVINPPQAAILAVGEMTPRPVVRDGEVTVRPLMELTLTCDHRILYGADAAQFLGRIRERLENPLSLAL